MKILSKLPYADEARTVTVRGELVGIKPWHIIVWVSVNLPSIVEWDSQTPALPVVVDTGNNHNFAIGAGQLVRWAGLQPEALRQLGTIRERGFRVPLHAANLWLQCNKPGTNAILGEPKLLLAEDGIAVYPDDTGPRLPILGLRALTRNRLVIVVNGHRRHLTLRTPRWWWPFD